MAYLYITPEFTGLGFSWKRPNYYDAGPNDRGGRSVAGFEEWALYPKLAVRYAADRERIETINFTITADVQPLVSSREDTTLTIELSSSEVDQPIDPGGLMPIRDIRRNSYMITDRGQDSLHYLMALGRARLLARARAISIQFTTTLEIGIGLSLRHRVTLTDPRLPGGTASGKVIALSLSGDSTSGVHKAEVTIACAVGRGGTLEVPAGEPEFADPSYYADGIQIAPGAGVALATGDIYSLTLLPTPITGGDTNLFSLTAAQAVESVTVTNGAIEQLGILFAGPNQGGGTWTDTNEAIAELEKWPTTVAIQMRPVTGDALTTPFTPTVSALIVPKDIDLETAP